MSATLKLPTFNGSRLRDFMHGGLLVTDVALSARSLRLVANHIGHLFNPSRYPERAMPAVFTEPAPAYPTGTGADGGLTPSEKYHHELAVAEWTARKKDSKDVRDDFAAQNAYLFILLLARTVPRRSTIMNWLLRSGQPARRTRGTSATTSQLKTLTCSR